jgi:hypothetical protein
MATLPPPLQMLQNIVTKLEHVTLTSNSNIIGKVEGSGTFAVTADTLPLPTNAATEATVASIPCWLPRIAVVNTYSTVYTSTAATAACICTLQGHANRVVRVLEVKFASTSAKNVNDGTQYSIINVSRLTSVVGGTAASLPITAFDSTASAPLAIAKSWNASAPTVISAGVVALASYCTASKDNSSSLTLCVLPFGNCLPYPVLRSASEWLMISQSLASSGTPNTTTVSITWTEEDS